MDILFKDIDDMLNHILANQEELTKIDGNWWAEKGAELGIALVSDVVLAGTMSYFMGKAMKGGDKLV